MDYMRRALDLARMALGSTSPNPAVGAVVVNDGEIVGEGYTQPPGSAHAEIVALSDAGSRAAGATMYVTLEPCAHYGRTPPCSSAVIQAGIAEVHMSILDPNPLVGGKGRQQLEEAGIKTYLGEGADEATEINEAFLKRVTTGMPFVTAKWAMSLDGKIATRSGDSKWITSTAARAYAHYLRAINDAVIVGIGTVLADDPELTARVVDAGCWGPGGGDQGSGRPILCPRHPPPITQPLRVVLDSQGRVPLTAKVINPAAGPSLVATTEWMDLDKRRAIRARGTDLLVLPERNGVVDLRALLSALVERGVNGVLIEGGGEVLGTAVFSRLVDKVCVFVAPKIIGGDGAPSPVRGLGAETMAGVVGLERQRVQTIGDDVLITAYISQES